MKDSLTSQQERMDVLKHLMPEVFEEGKNDFEKLNKKDYGYYSKHD